MKQAFLAALMAVAPSYAYSQVCEPNPVDCLTHDPTLWHGNEDPATGLCWDHEHGDDPRVLDWLFGPVGTWYGGPEVGSLVKQEAHHGYLWFTTGPDLLPVDQHNGKVYIAAMREQIHFITNPVAKTVRFHSYEAEFYICQIPEVGSQCGFLRLVGVLDFGAIMLQTPSNGPSPPYWPVGTAPIFVEREDYPDLDRPTRIVHPTETHLRFSHTWYGRFVAPWINLGASADTGDGTSSYELIDRSNVECRFNSRNKFLCFTPFDNLILNPEPGDETMNNFHFAHFNPGILTPLHGDTWFDPFSGQVKTDCAVVGPDCGLMRAENLPPLHGCCFQIRRSVLLNLGANLPPREHSTPACVGFIER